MDQRSEAIGFIAVALLVAIVDREIEASSGCAPEVVKTGDSGSGVVGDFRRVVVQQPVHQLVYQFDECILASVMELIANCNE